MTAIRSGSLTYASPLVLREGLSFDSSEGVIMDKEDLKWFSFPVFSGIVLALCVYVFVPTADPARISDLEYKVDLLRRKVEILEQHVVPRPALEVPARQPALRQERVKEGKA